MAGRRSSLVFLTTVVVLFAVHVSLSAAQPILSLNGQAAFPVHYGPGQQVNADIVFQYTPDCQTPINPKCDVYIVRSGSFFPALTDVRAAGPTMFQGVSGTATSASEVLGVTLPAGGASGLPPGDYAIVFDECRDGVFDGQDAVFDKAFEVSIPGHTLVTFENVAAGTLLRGQMAAQGLRVDGVGPFSGKIELVGASGIEGFGNSPTHVMDIGDRGQATTLRFVDPADSQRVLGAKYVSFIVGDGDLQGETFTVSVRDSVDAPLWGPVTYTTGRHGIPLSFRAEDLGKSIGSVTIMLSLNPLSASGAVLDDLDFALVGAPVTTGVHGPRTGQRTLRLRVKASRPDSPATQYTMSMLRGEVAHAIVFDINGREVRDLFEKMLPVGESEFEWDGRDDAGRVVGAGLYVIRVQADSGVATAKFARLR